MDSASGKFGDSDLKTLSTFCIVIDSTELRKALETVFNRINNETVESSERLEVVTDVARRNPELCLVVSQYGNNLCIWGIDVICSNTDKSDANIKRKLTAGMADL
jgi:hypothetical protein